LPGGTSLPRLLHERRGVPHRASRQPYSVSQILAWIDAHHARTGFWPQENSGSIAGVPGETWRKVDHALRGGQRGLSGGSSLAGLLRRHRGIERHVRAPLLSIERILRWADLHRKRTGKWPKLTSGRIVGEKVETWQRVENALQEGRRGLPKVGTLAQLLAEHRGLRTGVHAPPFTKQQILVWARAHLRKHGKWPAAHAGAIEGVPPETWINVDHALRVGARGLRGGSSLSRFLAREGRQRKAGR
jgi:hypothetical protein